MGWEGGRFFIWGGRGVEFSGMGRGGLVFGLFLRENLPIHTQTLSKNFSTTLFSKMFIPHV